MIIVTKHPEFANYCRELNLVPEGEDVVVRNHVQAREVLGQVVIGNMLPLRIAAKALSYIEVPLFYPAELKGKEMTLEQIREFAGAPERYQIAKIRVSGGE